MKAKKDLKGLPWTGGAIGNASWAGARLYDILIATGMTEQMAQEKVGTRNGSNLYNVNLKIYTVEQRCGRVVEAIPYRYILLKNPSTVTVT